MLQYGIPIIASPLWNQHAFYCGSLFYQYQGGCGLVLRLHTFARQVSALSVGLSMFQLFQCSNHTQQPLRQAPVRMACFLFTYAILLLWPWRLCCGCIFLHLCFVAPGLFWQLHVVMAPGSRSVQLHFCFGEYKGHEHHSFLAELKKLRREEHVQASRIILTTDWVWRDGRPDVSSWSFHEHALQEDAGGTVVCDTRYPTHPRHCKTLPSYQRWCVAVDAAILWRWRQLHVSLRAWLSLSGQSRSLYVVLEVTMTPDIKAINRVLEFAIKHEPDVMYFRKKREFHVTLSWVPRHGLLCRTGGDIGFSMVTECRSARHVNFRFRNKEFQTTFCHGRACLVPQVLWAKVYTFLLLEASEVIMLLHWEFNTESFDV